MNQRGLTLVELIVVLVLSSVVGSTVAAGLKNAERTYGRFRDLTQIMSVFREVRTILTSEFRGIDPVDGDLLVISSDLIRYRSIRGLMLVCRPPQQNSPLLSLSPRFLGLRGILSDVDSLLIFREGEPGLASDDRWLHAGIESVQPGTDCRFNAASVNVRLDNSVVPAIEAVRDGAPVLIAEVVELLSYRDGAGIWWLGMRRYKNGAIRPTAVQPIAGPIESQGVTFRYLDQGGLPTADARSVASIEVNTVAVGLRGRSISGKIRTQTFLVTLRNGF